MVHSFCRTKRKNGLHIEWFTHLVHSPLSWCSRRQRKSCLLVCVLFCFRCAAFGSAHHFCLAVRQPLQEVAGVLQRIRCNGLQCFSGEESLMRGDDHLGEGGQTGNHIVAQDVIGVVGIDYFILPFIDIQCHSMEFASSQPREQSIGVDKSAAGGVYQHDAILHHGDGFVVDQMVGAAFPHDEGAVDGDQVRALEQLLFGDVGQQTFFL